MLVEKVAHSSDPTIVRKEGAVGEHTRPLQGEELVYSVSGWIINLSSSITGLRIKRLVQLLT